MRGFELMQARKYLRVIYYFDKEAVKSLYMDYLEWYAFYLPVGATSREDRIAADAAAISIVMRYHQEQLDWLNGCS